MARASVFVAAFGLVLAGCGKISPLRDGATSSDDDAGASTGSDGAARDDVGQLSDAASAGDRGGCGDTQTSNANCGACGYGCVDGRQCVQGRCTPAWLPVAVTGAPSPRYRHGAAAIGGRVLLSGGTSLNNAGSFADSYFYDPAGDGWTAGPPLNQGRCSHSSVTGGDRVLVYGGLTDCSNGGTTGALDVEAYDAASRAWSLAQASSPPTPRYNASAVWLPSAELLVVGGSGNGFTDTPSAARFAAGAWRDATCNLAGCSSGWAALLVLDASTAVAWGGFTHLQPVKLDIASNAWSAWTLPAGSPPTPTQFADDGHRWLVLNGDGGADCPAQVVVRIYDKARGTWTADSSPAPAGLAVYAGSNNAVWTGSELFTWSAECQQRAVGGRYQPPAP